MNYYFTPRWYDYFGTHSDDFLHMAGITTTVDDIKITKANRLTEIKLLEVSTRLRLSDQKMILAIVGQISPNDEDFKDYKVTVSELVSLTGISSENLYRDIHSICTRLMSTVITIKAPENPKGFLMVTWFSHAEYLPDKSCVEFSISPKLKPYLLNLKGNFTTYHLNQVVHLKSTYAIRLYELLRQFLPLKGINNGRPSAFREITIKDLREYLGVEKNRYPRFADFRRHVIDRNQAELEAHTDLRFEFTPVRVGRKINAINFHIKQNEQFQEAGNEELTGVLSMPLDATGIDQHVMDCIRGQIPEITDEQLSLIGNTYSRELILEGLFDLMKAVTSGGIKGTPLNYYMGILKNKRREDKAAEPKPKQTTAEKLTDRIWAEGLEFGAD